VAVELAAKRSRQGALRGPDLSSHGQGVNGNGANSDTARQGEDDADFTGSRRECDAAST
jgi:hypothetical protein